MQRDMCQPTSLCQAAMNSGHSTAAWQLLELKMKFLETVL